MHRPLPRLSAMDLARYLPLSNRPRGDESSVASDAQALADVVEVVESFVAGRPGSAALMTGFVEEAGLSGIPSDPSLAAAIRTGPRRRARELARGVRAALALGDAVGEAPALDPLVLGRVALYASTSAPFDRRAAIAGRTVRASDADWQLGRGPVVEASSIGIVRFLLGLSDEPPRRQPPDVSAPMSPETTI